MRTFKNLWMLLAPTGLIMWMLACDGKSTDPPKSPSWHEINRMVLLKVLENNMSTSASSDSGGGQDTTHISGKIFAKANRTGAIALSDSGGGQDTTFTVALSDSGGGQDTTKAGGKTFKINHRFSLDRNKNSVKYWLEGEAEK